MTKWMQIISAFSTIFCFFFLDWSKRIMGRHKSQIKENLLVTFIDNWRGLSSQKNQEGEEKKKHHVILHEMFIYVTNGLDLRKEKISEKLWDFDVCRLCERLSQFLTYFRRMKKKKTPIFPHSSNDDVCKATIVEKHLFFFLSFSLSLSLSLFFSFFDFFLSFSLFHLILQRSRSDQTRRSGNYT